MRAIYSPEDLTLHYMTQRRYENTTNCVSKYGKDRKEENRIRKDRKEENGQLCHLFLHIVIGILGHGLVVRTTQYCWFIWECNIQLIKSNFFLPKPSSPLTRLTV